MCMLSTINQKLLGPNHAARVNVSCNAFFSSRTGKKKQFLRRSHCGKKKHKNVKNPNTSLLFFQTLFVLFLHVERDCKSFCKVSLTRTTSSFAQCSARTFKPESVFSICKQMLTKIAFVIFDIVVKKNKNKSNVV